ncbi:alpha/beta fold hydrolase [Nonomuraea roseoviolacea]|uniref:Pimeloyl-ACP methyl ester carboxylesterase n=1 Tax=Nonomuraea roseoviolacea subsp. carminata TaxID=160689 RepID=A0ABT1K9U7_9ACTN|nr:alpha/beta hydrolase [Nonomuraea roseoviolacea]MCP2350362.1 pimeloyl-ACP methyl ester carboxylesterase [Nonomuraea roseoviolacea subsp. carminata]
MDTAVTTGTLRVPGATLYYEVQGSGPLLLISQSGEGDARRSADLVDRLVADHTVVTYDRRGLSRSTLDDPDQGVTIAEHADDVHRLLAQLTDQPALMLGCSLGASIGLHLAVDHPDQISLLVAHEPVTPRLLPADQRAHHERELEQIQDVYRREGLPAAFKLIAEVLGIDPAHPDAEPGVTPQPLTPQRVANFRFFIERDFTAVIRDTLDVAALKNTGTRVVPVTGRTTPRGVFDHKCAAALAGLFGTELREFPGGHNGNTTHPSAYAATLRAVLAS